LCQEKGWKYLADIDEEYNEMMDRLNNCVSEKGIFAPKMSFSFTQISYKQPQYS